MFGELQLPTEVVSSEFLTMEGRQFSSSRGVVIYVRDMLARYQPDALRYFIAVAGPENQDTDFTWSEFVRRTNDELVAGWGNLVNRVTSMIHKNLGVDPGRGHPHGRRPRAAGHHGERASRAVGDLLRTHRQKQAVGEAMRVVGEANKYLSDQAPWKLRTSEPERFATVLHVAAQAVSDCRTLLSPFLPHSAQAVHEALGGTGTRLAAAARSARSTTSTAAPATRSSWATTGAVRPCRPGDRRRSCRARRCRRRPRSSASSTTRWSRRSWPGSPPRPSGPAGG